jgi:hypothetical protein
MGYQYFELYIDNKYIKNYEGHYPNPAISLKEELSKYSNREEYLDGFHGMRMSLDQSTSCTGIYITDKGNTFQLVGHLERRLLDKESYKETLKNVTLCLLQGYVLDLFVIEDVLNFDRGNSARKILKDLKRSVTKWSKEDLDVLDPEHMLRSIAAPIWKKHIIDKSKGKKRFNSKSAIAEDICTIFPHLERFFRYYPSSSGYDGFDAIGILEGFLEEFKYDEGINLIGGSSTYTGSIDLFFKLLEEYEIETELMKGFEYVSTKTKMHPLIINEEYSWYQNISKAISTYKFCFLQVTGSKFDIPLRIQFGMPLDEGVLVCFALRSNILKDLDYEILESISVREKVTW